MKRMSRRSKIKAILLSTVLISLLYYITPLRRELLLEILTRLYYIPITLGGIWFGFRGGLQSSIFVAALCVPHLFMASGHEPALFYDELLELFLFMTVGPVVGLLRDREKRQRILNQRLQALAALGETVASVAHEMKNMLIPIRGFLRRASEDRSVDAKARTYLQIVTDESAKLDKMVKDMLSFARHAPLQLEEVDVGDLAQEVKGILDAEFRDKGVQLVCQVHGRPRKLSLDRQRVTRALTNLIHNALQASTRGGEVRIEVEYKEDAVQVRVEDKGGGISKEHLDHIFKPFFTTKHQGTGLGLPITQRIVEEHEGEIRIESTLGNGTRVLLSFPVVTERLSKG